MIETQEDVRSLFSRSSRAVVDGDSLFIEDAISPICTSTISSSSSSSSNSSFSLTSIFRHGNALALVVRPDGHVGSIVRRAHRAGGSRGDTAGYRSQVDDREAAVLTDHDRLVETFNGILNQSRH